MLSLQSKRILEMDIYAIRLGLKHLATWLFLLLGISVMVSCGGGDDEEVEDEGLNVESDNEDSSSSDDSNSTTTSKADRTVIVYMSGENTLSSYAKDDLKEMLTGSYGVEDKNHLVVYYDDSSSTLPYIAEIKDGEAIVDSTYTFEEDIYSSDPEQMEGILTHIMETYEAKSYGLVLWGHGSGWLIDNDSIATDIAVAAAKKRAYGVDNGKNSSGSNSGYWINIPTLAQVLGELPSTFKFIMADCCQFQCVETLYELRYVTEYLIGSPAEIPGAGAPYEVLVPLMFSTADDFYEDIVDYYNTGSTLTSYGGEEFTTPLSALSTSSIEAFATATANILPELLDSDISSSNLVYYHKVSGQKIMFDILDLMNHYVAESAYYDAWVEALGRVYVYGLYSNYWMSDGFVSFSPRTFSVTELNYGGMSMFVPMSSYSKISPNPNTTISQMGWYYAIGMDSYEE